MQELLPTFAPAAAAGSSALAGPASIMKGERAERERRWVAGEWKQAAKQGGEAALKRKLILERGAG